MNAIIRAPLSGTFNRYPASPQTLIRIADEALAENDLTTATRFVEMTYEAFDEALAEEGTCLCTWAAISADVASACANPEAASLLLERACGAMNNVQISDALPPLLAVAAGD